MIDHGRLTYPRDYFVAASINGFVVFQISNFKNLFLEATSCHCRLLWKYSNELNEWSRLIFCGHKCRCGNSYFGMTQKYFFYYGNHTFK